MKPTSFFLHTALLMLFFGCSESGESMNPDASGDIATTDIIASLEAVSENGEGTRIRAFLSTKRSDVVVPLELAEGEKIFGQKGEEEREELIPLGEGFYESVFPGAEEDAEFRVVLERGENDSIAESIVAMPAPFAFNDESLPTGAISRATADLEVTWEPSSENDQMRIEIDDTASAACVFLFSQVLETDEGSFTLAAEELEATDDEDATCELTATFARERTGTIDERFNEESSFRSVQERSFTFSSSP